MWKSLRERQIAHRIDVLDELDSACQALLDVSRLFQDAIVSRQDLTGIEQRALDAIDRLGPITAGDLGTHTGLAPASVTGLIARLQKKGLVKRSDDPDDRRRARIERNPASLARIEPLKAELSAELGRLYETYPTDQLEVVVRFLTDMARRQTAVVARLM